MFCKECGTKNEEGNVNCTNCNAFLNLHNAPLTGSDRVKIVTFFVFLVTTIFFGIIPILISLIGIYIMKKDKDFKAITASNKYIKRYLFVLALGAMAIIPYSYYNSNKHFFYSGSYSTLADYEEKYQQQEDIHFKDLQKYTLIVTGTVLIAIPFITYLILILINFLYYTPLGNHQKWVVLNGIFTEKKADNTKGEDKENSTGIIGRDKLVTYSIADEVLKWNNLLEKGLISQKEFDDAKRKLLNQG